MEERGENGQVVDSIPRSVDVVADPELWRDNTVIILFELNRFSGGHNYLNSTFHSDTGSNTRPLRCEPLAASYQTTIISNIIRKIASLGDSVEALLPLNHSVTGSIPSMGGFF